MSYEDEGPDTWTGGDRDISEFKEQLRQLDRRVSAVAANTHVSQTSLTEIHKNGQSGLGSHHRLVQHPSDVSSNRIRLALGRHKLPALPIICWRLALGQSQRTGHMARWQPPATRGQR